MDNGNDHKLSNNSLETIPEEEIELPRISGLIPKSPETRKREQEFGQYYDKLQNIDKQRIQDFCEMLIVKWNLKRIPSNDRYLLAGKYANCGKA